jgi:hypothetical protein
MNPGSGMGQKPGGHLVTVHRHETAGPVLFDGFLEAQLAGAIQ